MEQLRISVTADDIKRGKRENTKWCPIACAVRKLGKKKRIYVDQDVITLGSVTYKMPQRAGNFVDLFDSGEKVRPFSFVAKKDSWR